MKTSIILLTILAINFSCTDCFKNADTIENSHLIIDELVNDFQGRYPSFDPANDTLIIKLPERMSLEKTGICDFWYFQNMDHYSNPTVRNICIGRIPEKIVEWRNYYLLTINHVCLEEDVFKMIIGMGIFDSGKMSVYNFNYSKSKKRFIEKKFDSEIIE